MDRLATQAQRVAATIEALMMLSRGLDPISEPRPEWLDQMTGGGGVPLDQRPFLSRGASGGPENLPGSHQLPEIVREGSPLESRPRFPIQPHLLADQLGVDPHPLAVAAGGAIVAVQQRQQDEQVERWPRPDRSPGSHRRRHAVPGPRLAWTGASTPTGWVRVSETRARAAAGRPTATNGGQSGRR